MKFIIKLDNFKIEFYGNHSFPYEFTNLPKREFSFSTRNPIFWELEEKDYDSATGTLVVTVVDYNLPSDSVLSASNQLKPIRKLCFENLSWPDFDKLLSSYNPHKLKDSFYNHPLSLMERKRNDSNNLNQISPNLFFSTYLPTHHKLVKSVKIKFEFATFEDSKLTFETPLKQYRYDKRIEIYNPHLRAEFEYIKPYFIRKIGQAFTVTLTMDLEDNKVVDVVAHSEDILKIDENLINSVKTSAILDLKRFRSELSEKILYSYNELSIDENILALLNISPENIVETFMDVVSLRNQKQLMYLSKEKQTQNDRILFTLNPHFGFVFHVIAENEYYIWELLNSHATYVWKSSVNKNGNQLFHVVEKAINTIKIDGRNAYKKYYKSLSNPGYSFVVIEHPSLNLSDDERFAEWLHKLVKI